MKKIAAIFEKFCEISGIFGGLLFFLLSIAITLDVVVRWIVGKPIVGVFEISQIVFLACTFLVLGLAQNKERHIRVDILIGKMKGKPRNIMEAIVGLLGLSFFLVLLYIGCKEWLAAWQGDYVRRGLIDIPNTIHLGFVVFGTLIICLCLIANVVVNLRHLVFPAKNRDLDIMT
jgi:TRAP-type C4-dicarboxylate transport system permease small subunit